MQQQKNDPEKKKPTGKQPEKRKAAPKKAVPGARKPKAAVRKAEAKPGSAVMMDQQPGAVEMIYTPEQRDKLIKKEYRRLKKIFKDLPTGGVAIVGKLINEAAFVAITLEEARMIIARDGIVETYQNGAAQFGIKKSSVVEVYDKFLNTYAKIVGQLVDRLPDGIDQEAAGAAAMAFVKPPRGAIAGSRAG